LKVTVVSEDGSEVSEDCKAQFLLQVWDPSSDPAGWVSKEEMGEILKAETDSQLSSKLEFNEMTSEFRSNWTDIDFYNVFSTFFDNEARFRIISYIPGSNIHGLDENTDFDELTSATFMITFLDGTIVDECADNRLDLSPFTALTYEQRGDTVIHNIAASGSSSIFTIMGRQVIPTKP
jgi:hypothetical protein